MKRYPAALRSTANVVGTEMVQSAAKNDGYVHEHMESYPHIGKLLLPEHSYLDREWAGLGGKKCPCCVKFQFMRRQEHSSRNDQSS